ncbi:MAG: hypothetical protein K0U36_05365 [Alphaproteobacteria bacterium]|nr:hypothetical protein [Alphaproteobacteria bacterium]
MTSITLDVASRFDVICAAEYGQFQDDLFRQLLSANDALLLATPALPLTLARGTVVTIPVVDQSASTESSVIRLWD